MLQTEYPTNSSALTAGFVIGVADGSTVSFAGPGGASFPVVEMIG